LNVENYFILFLLFAHFKHSIFDLTHHTSQKFAVGLTNRTILPYLHKLVDRCFSGKGIGYGYIFNENMDASLLKGILGTHLIETAELHYDVEHAEEWWFLQDNDPKHKSTLVRTWLFNHGIQCIEFPPYSPDLNPIEHLWADLARKNFNVTRWRNYKTL